MAAAVLVAKLDAGELEERNFATYEIRMMSKSNIFNRICFVESGAVKCLIYILSSSDSDSSSLEDNAAAALLNLSKHHSGITEIFESGGIPLVVKVMQFGSKIEAQKNAAAILFYLTSFEACMEAIGEIPEAISCACGAAQNWNLQRKEECNCDNLCPEVRSR